ncbi:MFS transporter [Amycolatopsis magusensis]|uniref:MFS transporter n=1 Tax=Amycolatopsis magusensis TaxID=882444 RepID=UPI003C2B0DFB
MGAVATPVSRSRVAIAGFIGTTIEFYDFYIYGTAAVLVFGDVFFPKFSATAGTIASLATFGVGFVARPLGAVLFGHFGDRVGRKRMLIVSLLLMGLSTVAVGLVPGYATLGVLAPVLLTVFRFLQGIGLGGEWGGAVLLSVEYAPEGKRGLYSSFPQLGPAVGFFLSGGVFLLLTSVLSTEDFRAWGWRIPFLLSAVLVVVGYYIRTTIAETPVFRQAMERAGRARVPLFEVVRRQGGVLLLASGAMVLAHTLFYTVMTFNLSYGTTVLKLSYSAMLTCTVIAAVCLGVATLASARLSDRLGRKRVCLAAAAVSVLWAFPMYWLMNTANPVLIAVALSGGMVIMGLFFGPMGAFLPELFATRYRYSGASVAYSMGGIIGGAVSPILATEFYDATKSSWPISLYLVGISVAAALCVALLKETYRSDLTESQSGPRDVLGHG